MPELLTKFSRKLESRTRYLDAVFLRQIIDGNIKRRADRFAWQEGLISSLWQAWSSFARETLLESALGAQTSSGNITTSQYSHHTKHEVIFICRQLGNNHNITNIRPLTQQHLEPTWADQTKCHRIVTGINSSNSGALHQLYASTYLNHLQLCRNACAHITKQMISTVNGLRASYTHNIFTHPSDMMLWEDPSSKDYLWNTWTNDMRLLAHAATQ